jgi:hypothetical protein
MIEGHLLAHQRLHTAHARRTVEVFDIELAVDGKLAVMTLRTEIPGPVQFHFSQNSENAPHAQFPVVCLMTTRARDEALIRSRFGKLQQLSQGCGSGLMQGGTKRHLHCLQIHAAGLSALGKDTTQQRSYFARDLGLDRVGRFFSSVVSVSSMGR